MDLYILRHGIAYDHGHPDYPDDDSRPLTPKGRRRTRRIARGMRDLGLRFDAILTSPLPRARQTAEIVVMVMGGTLEVHEALSPDGDGDVVLDALRCREPAPKSALLVGHEPYLSQMACRLLSGRVGNWLELRKGGLIGLRIDLGSRSPHARLSALLAPRHLTRIS